MQSSILTSKPTGRVRVAVLGARRDDVSQERAVVLSIANREKCYSVVVYVFVQFHGEH